MALQVEEIIDMKEGLKKEFAPESIEMMMDLVQKFQYSSPVKSTVRELASNAVDAIKERDVAKEILSGKAKVSDYYVESTGELTKDSKFNPDYYDLKWLSDDPNVRIVYEERGTEKDIIRIIDNGVGLGGLRLEKYFQLGFSSKRTSSWALGKFGIGGKAALSTGEPYYILKTRYNGKQFEFNVYSYKIESTIPPANLATGQSNGSYIFEGGYTAYYTNTEEKNGTEIIINTKKFRKQEYIDAVKSQLLYFDNIDLFVKNTTGAMEKIPVKAEILYEDSHLVISNNNQYSKPHMVLNKVNYGYIHFEELSLEDKMGNVGIKVNPDEVTVNPSREALVWDELTRAAILQRFKDAKNVAQRLISDGLDEKDFLKWLKLYLSLGSKTRSTTDPLSNLAGLVDLDSIEPTYKYDPTFKIGDTQLLLPGIKLEKMFLTSENKKNAEGVLVNKAVLKRELVKNIKDLNPALTMVLIGHEEAKTRTLQYFASTTNGFYGITFIPVDVHEKSLTGLEGDKELQNHPPIHIIEDVLRNRAKRLKALINSSSVPLNYDHIIVPDDWKFVEGAIEITTAASTAISLEEQRKLEERVVLFTPRGGFSDNKASLEWQKLEPKWGEVLVWSKDTTYYGTDEDSKLLKLASAISRPNEDITAASLEDREAIRLRNELGFHHADADRFKYIQSYGPNSLRTIMKVSQQLSTKMKDFKLIGQFFYREVDDTLTTDPIVVQWNTAKFLRNSLHGLKFLQGFDRINTTMHKKYLKARDYVHMYSRSLDADALEPLAVAEFENFMNQLVEIQLLEREGADVAEIHSRTITATGKPYSHTVGIDLEMYDLGQEITEYVEPIKDMMWGLKNTLLSGYMSEEVEREIKFYISTKGV